MFWKKRKTKVSLESLYEAQIPYGRFEQHSLFTHVNNNPNENRIKVIRFTFFVVVDKQFPQSFFFRQSTAGYTYIGCLFLYFEKSQQREENSLLRKTMPFIQQNRFLFSSFSVDMRCDDVLWHMEIHSLFHSA